MYIRTNDNTLITVKLMLFYELKDVNTMVSGGCIILTVDCTIGCIG